MKIKSLFLACIFSFTVNIFSAEVNNEEKEEEIPTHHGTVYVLPKIIDISDKKDEKELVIITMVTVEQGIMNQIREFRITQSLKNGNYLAISRIDEQIKSEAIIVPLNLDLFKNADGSFKTPNSSIQCKIPPIKGIFHLTLDNTSGDNALQNFYNEYLQLKLSKKRCIIQ